VESRSLERVKIVSRWDGNLMLIEKRSADTDIVRSAIHQQNHLDVTYLHRIERCRHLSLDTEIWPFNGIDPQLVREPSRTRRFVRNYVFVNR
jgi:hypothetical protein